MKRAVVTTGGTGGHIFPALAVAGELLALHPGLRLLFIGGEGPESNLARKAGLDFAGLPVRGVLGRGFRAVPALGRMAWGVLKAAAIIRTFRPDVVAGFGGYAGFCPVVAARLLGVPAAVHEQNSVPGLANRILGRLVNRVMTAYPDETGAFPSRKTIRTGNPVRPDIAALPGPGPQRVVSKRVLVLGGSQGAKAVNRVVSAAWPRLAAGGVRLWHQTGKADYEQTANAYQGQENVRVQAFIEDMAEAYAWADLVVGRAGASTLAEVAAAGLAAVLIPFPFATHDHQSVNASYLERAGAAVVLPERDLDAGRLADVILELTGDAARLAAMGLAARQEARPAAARDIAVELSRLAA